MNFNGVDRNRRGFGPLGERERFHLGVPRLISSKNDAWKRQNVTADSSPPAAWNAMEIIRFTDWNRFLGTLLVSALTIGLSILAYIHPGIFSTTRAPPPKFSRS